MAFAVSLSTPRPPHHAARFFGVLAGALVVAVLASILCAGLAIFLKWSFPPWFGPLIDFALCIAVVSGAWIGWTITREQSFYIFSVPCLVLGTGVLLHFGRDEKPDAGLYLPPPTPRQVADYDIVLWLGALKTECECLI